MVVEKEVMVLVEREFVSYRRSLLFLRWEENLPSHEVNFGYTKFYDIFSEG